MATPTNGGTAILPYYVAQHGENSIRYDFRVEDVSTLSMEEKMRVAQAHSRAQKSPRHAAPVLSTFPENLADVLDGYEEHAGSKQKSKEPSNHSSAFEQEQLDWIEAHGSEHIKRAIDRGYHVTGLYARERAALEFPGFIVDTQNAVSLKERISPTAEALELEEEIEAKLNVLPSNNGEDVRIMWAAGVHSGSQDADLSGIKREVVVVSNYLGRYSLIKPVARPSQDTRLATNPVSVHVANIQNHAKAAHSKAANKAKHIDPSFPAIKTQFTPGRPLIISFTSSKGGVGKSTTATSVAAYITKAAEASEQQDLKVLLVDGDIVNGNLALRVLGKIEPNLLDLLNHMDEVQRHGGELGEYEQDIGRFMLDYPKLANLDILAAPDNPDVIKQIEQDDLDYLMERFARFYDVIIFDTGTQLTDNTNCAWLNYSQQVYFMAEPEISCLQATAEYVKRARRSQLLTPDECRLIMTHCDVDADTQQFDPRKAASEIFSFIPPDRVFFMPDLRQEAVSTANAGELLILTSTPYAASVGEIVKHALEHYEDNANRGTSENLESTTSSYQTLREPESVKVRLTAEMDLPRKPKSAPTSFPERAIATEVVQLFPAYIARVCRAMPLKLEIVKEGSQLRRAHIALVEFENADIKQTIKTYLRAQDPALEVEFTQETPQAIDKAIQEYYGT